MSVIQVTEKLIIAKEEKMANKWFILGMLTVVLLFGITGIVCAQNSGGTFTLTNIPSQYDGKYMVLRAERIGADIFGAERLNTSTGVAIASRISNGRVSIPLWSVHRGGGEIIRNFGNHVMEELEIYIIDSANYNFFDDDDNKIIDYLEFSSVRSSNGSATRSWANADD